MFYFVFMQEGKGGFSFAFLLFFVGLSGFSGSVLLRQAQDKTGRGMPPRLSGTPLLRQAQDKLKEGNVTPVLGQVGDNHPAFQAPLSFVRLRINSRRGIGRFSGSAFLRQAQDKTGRGTHPGLRPPLLGGD